MLIQDASDDENNNINNNMSSSSHLRPAVLYDHVPTDESIQFQKQFQYNKPPKQKFKDQGHGEKQHSHNEEEIAYEYDQRRTVNQGDKDQEEDQDQDDIASKQENDHQHRSYNNFGYYVSYMVHQVSAPLGAERRTSIGSVEDSQLEGDDQLQQNDDDLNEENDAGRNNSLSFSWFFRDSVSRKHHHPDGKNGNESGGSDTGEVQARRDSDEDDAKVRVDSNGRGYDFERMDTILETDDNDYVFVPISASPLIDARGRKNVDRSVSADIVSRAVPKSLLSITVSLVTGFFKQVLLLNHTILDVSKSAKATKNLPQKSPLTSSRRSETCTKALSTAVSTTVYDEQGNGLILPGECIDIDLESRFRPSSYMSGAMITERPDHKNGNLSSCLMQEFNDGVDAVDPPLFTRTLDPVDDDGDDTAGTLIVPPYHQTTSHFGSHALSSFKSRNTPGKGSAEAAASFPVTKGPKNNSLRPSDCERFGTSWFGTGARSKTIMISASDLLIMEQKDAEQRRIKKRQAKLGGGVHNPTSAVDDMFPEIFESSPEHLDVVTTTVGADSTTVEQWVYALWQLSKSRAGFQQDVSRPKCSIIAGCVVDSSFAKMLRNMANEVTKVNYRNILSPQELLHQIPIMLSRKMTSYLHFDRRLILETRPIKYSVRNESRLLGSDEEVSSDLIVDENKNDAVEKGEVELARLN